MTRLIHCLGAMVLAAIATFADAQNSTSPVVIELFTSQGCSSCPPADRMLHDLAARDDVIALALHVDYWDYIGWKDKFASPAHSERQRTYAVVAGRRSVYTPQMIVNGVTSVVGARGMELADAIRAHSKDNSGVSVDLVRKGAKVEISLRNTGQPSAMVVNMLRYTPRQDVRITRGENAGHTYSYANVVQDMQVVSEWSGAQEMSLSVDARGDLPVVVIVQAQGQGPILAASELR